MGRFIEQGEFQNNYWGGARNIPPQGVGAREKIKKSGLFKPGVFDKTAFLPVSENRLLAAGLNEVLLGLAPYMESVTFRGNEYLYNPGDRIEYVYFPETAVVSEFQILEDGRTVEIAMTGREGVVGFLPILKACSLSNWTQIFVPGRAYKLSFQVFEQEIARSPRLRDGVFDYISRYIKQVSQRAVCNSYHTIEQRFCSWLLMVQERKGGSRLPLTQEQIARALGVHRPSVTHIAQHLRERKIIDYVRGKIIVCDSHRLEKTACGCFSEIDARLPAAAKSVGNVM
ncbi:MAG: Crp/Fnr family transcriptional regulator [Acidobacteria bacterium]|nr:Crp/Fnr family transcriptional regulator [Acidobacteriota bacterium]